MNNDNNEALPNGSVGPQSGEPMGQPMPPNPTINTPPSQPMGQPIMNNPAEVNNVNAEMNMGKKKNLILGCSVGAVAVITVVILLVLFLGNGSKTLSCALQETLFGTSINTETNIKIKDGAVLSGSVNMNMDLKNLSDMYKDYEKEFVDELIEEYKEQCEEDCTFNYDYVENDHLSIVLDYTGEGVNEIVYTYNIENLSAQEIADKLQASIEKTEGVTCKQD